MQKSKIITIGSVFLRLTLICLILVFPLKLLAAAINQPLHIVAAENFYGAIAKELGGDHVQVASILNNPNQDPHLFSAAPSTAKIIAEADIVVYNGLGYDSWMERLLSIAAPNARQVIVVAQLVGRKLGDNPHIWYMPITMNLFAQELTRRLSLADPSHKNYYNSRLQAFLTRQAALNHTITQLKQKLNGLPVAATEPVFNDMADALGLTMHGIKLQWAVMNETPPSTSQVKAFIDDLQQQRVRLLIFNNQTTDTFVDNIKLVAQQNNIPMLGVTEMQPLAMTYQQWMTAQLQQLAAVLKQ